MSFRIKLTASWFYENLYTDEKIKPRTEPGSEPVPEAIRAMRAMATAPESFGQPREAVFVRQAQQMAAYEDDYPFTRDVVRYFPTYEALTDRELRGYFAWRTAWRRGERRKTSLSFAFLYIYELLNQAGVTDPVDGYEKLWNFAADYGELDEKILAYLKQWLWDYVIYYRLDPVLLASRPELEVDRQLLRLREMEQYSDAKLFEAAMALSSYRLDNSKLYRAEPEAFSTLTARVLRRMDAYYKKHRKQTLAEDWFGVLTWEPVTLFESAVFSGSRREERTEYEVDPLCRYACVNGRWSVCRVNHAEGRSKKLGDVLRTLDSMLREAVKFKNPMQPGLSTKWIVKLISEEIAAWQQEKEAAEKRNITIDFSRLSAIRYDAGVTRDKLIVDEERDEEPEIVPEAEGKAGEDGLNEDERRFLCALLSGGSLSWLREKGLLCEVLSDSINEKLYDRFGDTVLESGDPPTVVDDYRDELKEMVMP